MNALCGADCEKCGYGKGRNCAGCHQTQGCPFGTRCFIFRYIKTGGASAYEQFKRQLIDEFNALQIPGMPQIDELFPMNGTYVNMEYPVPGGKIKLLDDDAIYLCNQVESEFNDGTLIRCFGLAAGLDFLLVSEFGANGSEPELLVYKKR